MNVYEYGAARMFFYVAPGRHDGVNVVEFRGLLTAHSLGYLLGAIADRYMASGAVVARYEGAAIGLAAHEWLDVASEFVDAPPTAVVCSAAQLDQQRERAALLAATGIRRVVFCSDQAGLAHRWARLCASRSLQGLPS